MHTQETDEVVLMPARMVGCYQKSDSCNIRDMDVACVRVSVRRSHGWLLLTLFCAVFLSGTCMARGIMKPMPLTPEMKAKIAEQERVTPEEMAAAKGVESMLVDHMIQEMRKSVPENSLMPPSQGERIFQSMLDSEYAKAIAESSPLGIADLVIAQMKGKR